MDANHAPARHRLDDADDLDRSSYVPLYIQLQEVLKQRLESGRWRPGDPLPSEPELASRFEVSRNVVRQALAILEDDRHITRIRGRGTFVAEPKLEYRAGGLARLLVSPRTRNISIQVIEARELRVEDNIRSRLNLEPNDETLRVMTLISARGVPFALATSYFRRSDVPWLEVAARPGRALPKTLTLAEHGILLTRSDLAIETTRSGQFEADRFGVPPQSTAFLVFCTEFRRSPTGEAPFEVARIEYRGDMLQFRLAVSEDSPGAVDATLSLEDST